MNEEDNPIKQFQNWEERKATFRKKIFHFFESFVKNDVGTKIARMI